MPEFPQSSPLSNLTLAGSWIRCPIVSGCGYVEGVFTCGGVKRMRLEVLRGTLTNLGDDVCVLLHTGGR